MPLNNQHLTLDLQNFLKEIPLDEPCNDVPYQTKVGIYDDKCSDCGFALIIAYSSEESSDQRTKRIPFNNVESAIAYARANGCNLKRTCTYPNDIVTHNNNGVYPTLQEIVSNTCQFWNIEKMNIPSDDETDFVETITYSLVLPAPKMEKVIG